jgi:hypothetical protein
MMCRFASATIPCDGMMMTLLATCNYVNTAVSKSLDFLKRIFTELWYIYIVYDMNDRKSRIDALGKQLKHTTQLSM